MGFGTAVRVSLAVLVLPCLASAAEVVRTVPVPGHGSLRISLPSTWRCTTEPSPEGGADTLRLEPPQGTAFLLRITPAWVPAASRDADQAAQWMRMRLTGQTVEQEIPVEQFKGSRNTVSWFSATNRNPAPGEHEAMAQGAAIVGELLVGFTLLHHPGDLPERAAVLRALGGARQVL